MGRKFIQVKIRAIGIYTRLVCGWGENYTSQYKYEACIKRKNDMEGLYKKGMMGKGCIKTDDNCDRVIFLALF